MPDTIFNCFKGNGLHFIMVYIIYAYSITVFGFSARQLVF